MSGFTARELRAEFGVCQRTLRWYVEIGVLPRPSRGRHARWPAAAWSRLDELRRAADRKRTLAEWAEKFESAPSPSPPGPT